MMSRLFRQGGDLLCFLAQLPFVGIPHWANTSLGCVGSLIKEKAHHKVMYPTKKISLTPSYL
jgi:hypothetical protein